jgi:hypothetical protein
LSPVQQPARITENQTFTHSIVVSGATVSPIPGLYQAAFTLGEADFLRLKSSSPWLTTAGGAVLSFGLAYSLPLVVKLFFAQRAGTIANIPAETWWVGGIAIAAGIALLIGGQFFSRERRAVLKRIQAHFQTNPAELAHRMRR